MDPNKTFVKKTTAVEAVQFTGWQDAVIVLEWLNAPAYFVPDGYDHRFRRSSEYGTDGISPGAPGFLVVSTPEGWVRADPGGWIVKDENGALHSYSSNDFAEAYDKKS